MNWLRRTYAVAPEWVYLPICLGWPVALYALWIALK